MAFAQTSTSDYNIIDSSLIEQPADRYVSEDIKIPTSTPFSFSVSETLIDFGPISPTDPVLRTNTLSIEDPSKEGFEVIAYEENPLKNISTDTTIPDTTCDSGACNSQDSGLWEAVLTYGFGYRCDSSNNSCSSGFSQNNFYKQFEKEISGQNAVENQDLQSAKVQITYKVNISGTQQPGFYGNTIIFIAVPDF